MSDYEIYLTKSPSTKANVHIIDSIYCKNGTVYINTGSAINLDDIGRLEREIKKQKDRYENVLRGLNYWREKFQNEQRSVIILELALEERNEQTQ